MVNILIRHKIADFNTWKSVFDETFMFRKSAGERSFRLYRDAGDPLSLTLFFEWESAQLAQKFLNSEQLKREMEQSGVQGQSEMSILLETVAMRRTAAD